MNEAFNAIEAIEAEEALAKFWASEHGMLSEESKQKRINFYKKKLVGHEEKTNTIADLENYLRGLS